MLKENKNFFNDFPEIWQTERKRRRVLQLQESQAALQQQQYLAWGELEHEVQKLYGVNEDHPLYDHVLDIYTTAASKNAHPVLCFEIIQMGLRRSVSTLPDLMNFERQTVGLFVEAMDLLKESARSSSLDLKTQAVEKLKKAEINIFQKMQPDLSTWTSIVALRWMSENPDVLLEHMI